MNLEIINKIVEIFLGYYLNITSFGDDKYMNNFVNITIKNIKQKKLVTLNVVLGPPDKARQNFFGF